MSSLDDSLKIIINELKAQKDALILKQNKLIDAENDLRVEIMNANRILNDKKKEQQIVSDETLIKRQKTRVEELQKEFEEKNNEFRIYGPEEEKKLQKVSELEPKVMNLKKAIKDVEPAIKEIWDLLENDNFDIFVGHK